MTGTRLLTGLAVALLGGLLPLAANAQDDYDESRFYMAPMASYSFFDEDTFEPDDETGGTLALGKSFGDHLALELYAFHFNDVDITRSGTGGNFDSTGYGISALLFPARDVFPIFGIVGVGEGEFDFDQVSGFGPGIGNINEQDSDFVDLGIGFLVPVNDFGLAIRGEYRYRTSDVDAVNGGEYKFRDQIVSLGLQIPLGAKPEPAPVVQPAPEPAPPPPPPPTDSDGDGVPDNRDRCPGTAPGTEVNRFGCPTVDKAPVVLKGVTFEFDSARLTATAENRLANVVNALQAAERIDVRIEGHTDSLGTAAYNLRLSQERADSVKRYLVQHGISPARLVTRGYGETRPVAPNTLPNGEDNPAGRAKNRRVELHVIDE